MRSIGHFIGGKEVKGTSANRRRLFFAVQVTDRRASRGTISSFASVVAS
jgi:hypothetical protein